ncbi:MAG TPA: Kdo hydroxylase family protein [Bryobacterales bacterium]|nr:Kdo hydroxylase family protein [Bryobacterales bacterium]
MELVTVHPTGGALPLDQCARLERGDILFFPSTPFELTEEERGFLLHIQQTGAAYHKNIAYRPSADRVTGFAKAAAADAERLRATLRGYSERVIRFVRDLLPHYGAKWRIDFASFRPQEEEGRALPLKKRNDLLHVDAFPTRPTGGDLILRVFTNIHPSKPRVWVVSDPFAALAPRYAAAAGLEHFAARGDSPLGRLRRGFVQSLRAAGLPLADRTPYDRFMLHFHDYLKENREYQETCRKYRFEFPPGSTWMVFTDVVPHSVLSGQYALEQTLLVARESLVEPPSAPVAILEDISKTRLGNGSD